MNPIFSNMNAANAANTSMPQGLAALMQAMKSGGDPVAFISSLTGVDMKPLLAAKGNDALPALCRTLCKQKGLNFDEIYAQAQQMMNQLNK